MPTSNLLCYTTTTIQISISAFNALRVLSTQLDVFPPNETVVLLDIIITEGTKNDTVSDTQFIQVHNIHTVYSGTQYTHICCNAETLIDTNQKKSCLNC